MLEVDTPLRADCLYHPQTPRFVPTQDLCMPHLSTDSSPPTVPFCNHRDSTILNVGAVNCGHLQVCSTVTFQYIVNHYTILSN